MIRKFARNWDLNAIPKSLYTFSARFFFARRSRHNRSLDPQIHSRARSSSGKHFDPSSWESFAMIGNTRSEAKRIRSLLPWDARNHLKIPQAHLTDSLNRMLSIPELHLHGLSEPQPSPEQMPSEAFERDTISKVKRVRTQRSDEDLHNLGIKKLISLLLIDPASTQLGLTIVPVANGRVDKCLVEQSVDHAFSRKASSTIDKRACSLVRFEKWQQETRGHSCPFRINEHDVYEYLLLSLEAAGAGATSPSSSLESLRFVDGVAKLVKCDLKAVISPRHTRCTWRRNLYRSVTRCQAMSLNA